MIASNSNKNSAKGAKKRVRDNWFAKTPAWLFTDKGFDSKEKLVFTALGLFADTERRCFPSIRLLAEFCSLGRATVERALRGLEKKGVIAKKFRYEKNIQTTTLYTLAKARYEAPAPSHRRAPPITEMASLPHTDGDSPSHRWPEQSQLTHLPIDKASEQQNDARAEISEKEVEKDYHTNIWARFNRRGRS